MRNLSFLFAIVLANAFFGCYSNALLLSTSTTPMSSPSSTDRSIYDELAKTPLVRASDQELVTLPSLWRHNTPFGIGDETAVCAFLRHYGWFLCWEHASQLRDSILFPATNKRNKLFFVGVGTGDAAAEFAEKLNLNPELCFGDDGGAIGDVLQLEKGIQTMWNPPAVNQMMSRNDETSLKKLGEAYKAAADNIGIKNLAPKKN